MNKRFLAIVTILLMLFSCISPAAKASAEELPNPYKIEGNDKDIEKEIGDKILGGWTQYKIENPANFTNGIHVSDDGMLKVNLTFDGNNVSWTYAEGNSAYVGFVFVKAANGGYLYSYDGNGDIFENLHGLEGHAISHISFYYQQAYSLKVLKVDKSDINKKLSGAEFTLTKDGDTAFSKVETTGNDGYATFSGLAAGTYHVKETVAPSGYDLSTEIKDVTLPNNGGDAEITFEDSKTPPPKTYSIKVLKVDKSDNSVITTGAEFTLTKDGNTTFSKIETTGNDGYAAFSNLEAGTYHLKETKAPSGYDLSTEVKDITLPNNGGDAEISFADTKTTSKKYSIKVVKVDLSDNNIQLEGAEFSLTKENDDKFAKQTGITEEDGTVTFSNLETGTYYVTETKAPDGYDITTTEAQKIVLPDATSSDGNVEFKFYDKMQETKKYSIKVIKVDESDKITQLPGAEFTLTKENDTNFKKTGITGDDGTVTFGDLIAGKYYVTETKAPDGYNISTTESREIVLPNSKSNDGNVEFKFYDSKKEPPKYSIKVIKIDDSDEETQLPGAEFTLTKENDTNFKKTGITGDDGTVTFGDLIAGKYYVTETKAPDGYNISTTEAQEIVLPDATSSNGNVEFKFYDSKKEPPKYSIKVIKVDESDKITQLKGAEFTLTKENDTNFKKTGITGDDGTVTFGDLIAGKYYVTETKAPDGYNISTTESREIVLPNSKSNDGNVEFKFYDSKKEPPKYSIKVLKVDKSDRSIITTGAEFILTMDENKEFSQTGITGTDGYATFSGLTAGTYHLKETKAPNGYDLSTEVKNITLPSNGGNAEITFEDIKTPPPNVYSLKAIKVDASNESIYLSGAVFELTKKDDSSFKQSKTTGTDGYVIFDNLPEATYYIKETAAPEGYEISPTTYIVNFESLKQDYIVRFFDSRKDTTKYNLTVLKLDEDEEFKPLSGAEFTLTKKDNTSFKQTGITGTNGQFTFTNLEAGTYYVQETKAPDGYELPTNIETVVLPSNKEVGDAGVIFRDKKQDTVKYGIKVIKIDLSDNKTQLPGAEFTLTSLEDKNFKQTGITGSDGTCTFTNLVPGTYYVTETKAPAGYEIATSTQTVSVPFNDGNAEVKFYDSRHVTFRYNITAVKVDENDNSKLQGAEFTLTKQYDSSFKQTGITGSDGTVIFNNLLAGTYYVEETKAPAGYEISKKVETIVLPSSNGDAVVTFNDKKQLEEKYSLKIFKVDTSDKNKKLVGAEFTLTKDGDKSFSKTGITGSDGSVTFDNLTAGTYSVEETKAPDGYEISTLTQTVTLPSQDKNVEITFYDDPSENEIPIIDEPEPGAEPILPKTGELPPELFYGFGAAFVLLGIYLKKRK